MSFTLSEALSFDKMSAMLPQSLRERAAALVQGSGPFLLLSFRGSDVVSSREVKKALQKLPAGRGELVAAAPNFTAEARELLSGHAATVISQGEFHWTDESYAQVRQD
jgi:hypothetical protein